MEIGKNVSIRAKLVLLTSVHGKGNAMSEQCEFCGKMRNDGAVHVCNSMRHVNDSDSPIVVRESRHYTVPEVPSVALPSKTTFSYLKPMGSVELVIRARGISRLIDHKQEELKEINRLLEKNT